jgi:glycosyltransferase involved in cell wall biosynthesis
MILRELASNTANESHRKRPDVALVFVGQIVPDCSEYHNAYFSKAGNMFQENILIALKNAGMPALLAVSGPVFPSFSAVRVLARKRRIVTLAEGQSVVLLPFINFGVLKWLSLGISELFEIGRWAWHERRASPKVILTHNLSLPSGAFTLLASRLVRAKAVAFIADIYVPGQISAPTLLRRLDFWLHKKMIPKFDGLVVVNKRIIEDFAPDAGYLLIECGVREELLDRFPDPLEEPPQEKDTFTIAFAGTLSDMNGISILLEAFDRLKGSKYRLRLAGIGGLVEKVLRAAERDPRIEYLGYVSPDEVYHLYETADVLVNMRPTRSMRTVYGFPSKLMEYLITGKPVITTCAGNVEEEFSDKVILLRDETAEGLATALEKVATMSQVERARIGLEAREYIRANKTWKVYGDQMTTYIRREVLGLTPS